MTNVVIRSQENNAAATSLALALAGHEVALLGAGLAPGEHSFQYLGQQKTVRLSTIQALNPTTPTAGVVFAEGESVRDGIEHIIRNYGTPDFFAIIGGGISGIAEALNTAKAYNISAAHILHVGSFIVNGTGSDVKAEKRNVLAGFLDDETPSTLIDLAEATFPQIAIGDGPTVALSSVNAFVHLPPMLLNAMNVERGENLRLYVEGFGDSVCRLLEALDEDRLRLGNALGCRLTPIPVLLEESRGPEGLPGKTLREKINSFPAYQHIKLPSSLHHRYLSHELRSTFSPMNEIAKAIGIQLPSIHSVVRLGEILLATDLSNEAKPVARQFLKYLPTPIGQHRT
ncbi:NAD/NADP octopine/nopaline dehydrogenase family protein [Pseudarthrobacter oxydans]|uniref:NAD/NADP octopine/nopaline dehydrogenase family protein n=1 Tax=Micrococcaceae TaxID=1268 RepID=UPI001574B2BA|nr:NAD/NADP octopine/nopaline dehydrogenase family protein [Pseudarthrobacter oxydans]NSX38336.1 NAD/NADP octopine/nopaline dehydrogenase family protein [Pseudarthrobacter oxydans]